MNTNDHTPYVLSSNSSIRQTWPGEAGYQGFYTEVGEDDITTIGGSYPLIGFQGGTDDSLVFRIPLTRACGAAPVTGLSMDFDAANKHLPDLVLLVFSRTNGYWDGDILGNEGQVVTPTVDANRLLYLPFERLVGDIGSTTSPVSRERQINNAEVPVVPNDLPLELSATSALASDFLTDDAGTETNNLMLCPVAGEALSPGAVSIEVANSVELVRVSGGAASFIQSIVTDSSIFYAVEIPAGLAVDACFSLDIETQLIFCDAGFVCLNAIFGCPGSTVPVEDQVAVAAEFMLDCADLRKCYEYRAGSSEVDISFDLPVQSDLCSSQTYGVVYVNNGNGSLSDLLPVIQIPAGLDVDLNSFDITLVGGGTMDLSPPVQNPDSNTIYGDGYVFDQAEIEAFLNPNDFEVGDIIIISFMAATSCDFIDGTSLAARLNVADACQQEQQIMNTVSDPIRVVQPDAPMPVFELDLPDLIQISCSDSGTELLITTLNVGKAATSQVEVMFTVPAGFSITADNLEVIAPSGFTIDEVTETDLGGGITMYSFTGPDNIDVGDALCVKVTLSANDLDCGVYQLSAGFKQMTAPLDCPTDPANSPCTLSSLLSESSIFDVEVVPSVTAGVNSTVSADCGAAAGTFDVTYDLEIVAPSADFSGAISVELYKDVNGNGTYEDGVDLQLGTTMAANVAVDSGGVTSLSGTFVGIDAVDVCPVLIRIVSPGCACGASIFAIDNILPTFIEDLGESFALCPGEVGMLTGICAPLDYSFDPSTAGTVTNNLDGTVSFSLNPGISEGVLRVGGAFGLCPVDVEIPVISPMEFEFGPYTATVCDEGSQEVDLNIPPALQEDLEILITPSTGLDDPTSFEPVISNLQSDQVYNVQFTLNGTCMAETTLSVTVDQAPMVELVGNTACLTRFNLQTALTLTPADLTGEFQTMGDGTFTTGTRVPGATEYIPGPLDREAGQVSFRFITDDPEGPCGPDVARMDFTILLVDCGSFFWDGSND